jgi:hypothetical protein
VFPRIFGGISIKLKNHLCTEREFFNRIGQVRAFGKPIGLP